MSINAMMRKSVQTVLWCVVPLDIFLPWTVWYRVYQQWGSDSVERGDHTTGPVQTRSCHTLSVINTIRTQQPGQMLSHYWTSRLSAWPAEASFNGLGFGQFPGQATDQYQTMAHRKAKLEKSGWKRKNKIIGQHFLGPRIQALTWPAKEK